MKLSNNLINFYFFGISWTIQKVTKYKNKELTKKIIYYKPIIKILSRQRFEELKTFLSW